MNPDIKQWLSTLGSVVEGDNHLYVRVTPTMESASDLYRVYVCVPRNPCIEGDGSQVGAAHQAVGVYLSFIYANEQVYADHLKNGTVQRETGWFHTAIEQMGVPVRILAPYHSYCKEGVPLSKARIF